MKIKTSHEYKSVIVCIFSFAVIWLVLFMFKTTMLPFLTFKKLVKTNQICMAYFLIKMIGWQKLELGLIKDQICQKVFTRLKYGGTLKFT